MGKLDGKSVIVTGASRGIGARSASICFRSAAWSAPLGRKKRRPSVRGSLESTVSAIKNSGGERPQWPQTSRSRRTARSSEAARETYGPIDVLVNNAALTYFVPVKGLKKPAKPADALLAVISRAVYPQPARVET